jgi:periplasmic divalent cation tolerance protein
MKNKVFLVFSSCADESVGTRIARGLVAERLAARVSPQRGATSVHRWRDELREDRGRLLVAKPSGERLAALTTRLEAMHEYELPEHVAVPVTAGLPGHLNRVVDKCAAPRPAG